MTVVMEELLYPGDFVLWGPFADNDDAEAWIKHTLGNDWGRCRHRFQAVPVMSRTSRTRGA